MALYLGNQKVSLRSGQDPTFDYGFDSNGSLVFANKNATEINNFLNYDSSYSEILDLSNLSKMEKVAVNGTADRKMEGLKGLLVSPNAPFTGSSPQINASYTGLNKSALVSLFESVPYNVGYEKVGNPTIVDGVVSGFSKTDLLQLPQITRNYNSNIEFFVRFKTPEIMSKSNMAIITYKSQSYTPVLWVYGGSIFCKPFEDTVFGTGQVEANTWYRVRFAGNNGTWTLTVYNDNEVVLSERSETYASGTSLTGILQIANYYGDSYPVAAIDLNETYIKVNGVPWFTGKPAMTKTCSIVGTTGTADLTQEDKNIVLNKGWSLTVQ